MSKLKRSLVLSALMVSAMGCLTALAQPDRPPYASAVQKFKFPETLEEQEEALRSNPIMQRFAAARNRQAERILAQGWLRLKETLIGTLLKFW